MAVDAAIIAFTGFFTWRGYRRGLLASISTLFGFAAATAAALFGYRVFARPLRSSGMSEGTANIAGALIIFVAVSLLFFAGSRALTRALDITTWGKVNRAGGAAVAAAWSTAIATAVLLFMSVAPSAALNARVRDSALGRSLVREAPRFALSVADTNLRRLITSFWGRDTKVAATLDFVLDTGAERQLFAAVNDERRARGLRALTWDEGLARAARGHAADMYTRGYFGHDTPDGLTPGDRLSSAGVPFRITAENIALALTVPSADHDLFRSRSHRAHILSGAFSRVGIGVMYGDQGFLIAEEFAA